MYGDTQRGIVYSEAEGLIRNIKYKNILRAEHFFLGR